MELSGLQRMGIKRVVAVGAHPDDIEIGCIGTLLKLKDTAEIHVFVGCIGSAGDPSSLPKRAEESRAAFESIAPMSIEIRLEAGITHAVYEGILKSLECMLDRVKPDLILCHGPKDTHQEHRLMWEICLSSARRVPASILHYGGASCTADFAPKVFVDISEQYEAKKAALAKHVSQADKDYMNSPHIDIFHSNTYASLHGICCSEAFELFRGFL